MAVKMSSTSWCCYCDTHILTNTVIDCTLKSNRHLKNVWWSGACWGVTTKRVGVVVNGILACMKCKTVRMV